MIELYTVEQVAERSHHSPRTVQRWIHVGLRGRRLQVVPFGKRSLITARELEAFIKHLESVGKERRA